MESKVRQIRTRLGLSQPQFANRLECGLTSARRWEYSGRLPENKGVLNRLRAAAREAGIALEGASGSNGHSQGNGHAAELLNGLHSPDARTRNAAIVALAKADARTQAEVDKAVAAAVAAQPMDAEELADWRSLDGEPFRFPDESGAATDAAQPKAAAKAGR